NLAIAAMDMGEYESAQAYGKQALAIAEAVGARRDTCTAILLLGETYRMWGDYASAELETERALSIARTLGDQLNEDYALMNLSAIAAARGDLKRARRYIEQ